MQLNRCLKILLVVIEYCEHNKLSSAAGMVLVYPHYGIQSGIIKGMNLMNRTYHRFLLPIHSAWYKSFANDL